MKKSFASVAAIAVALTAGSALAGPAAGYAQVLSPWDGPYAGLNAGAHFGNSSFNLMSGPSNSAVDTRWSNGFGPIEGLLFSPVGQGGASSTGFTGGGHIGYQNQYGNFVGGVEGDIRGLSGGTGSSLFGGALGNGLFDTNQGGTVAFDRAAFWGANVQTSLDYLSTFRVRFGYLATPALLVYGTGGLAIGGIHSTTTQGLGISNVKSAAITGEGARSFGFCIPQGSLGGYGSYSAPNVGWTAGAGAEWAVAPSVSVRVEYLHYDVGSINYANTPIVSVGSNSVKSILTVSSNSTHVNVYGDIVGIGVSYHFGTSAQ